MVTWQLRSHRVTNDAHTLIMGILNVTPDSFSDGGRYVSGRGVLVDEAVASGLDLWRSGADIVDVGGESTRPGSRTVDSDDEMDRVVPVVRALASEGVIVSVDTSKPEVAEASIAAGAEIVNDVTGLRSADMMRLCADSGVGAVIMHMRGEPATMQDEPVYDDVVPDVVGYLLGRAAVAEESGIDATRICLDPGIGFGKTHQHNLELLHRLDALVATGYPTLLGASRKGFLGGILDSAGHPAPAASRDAATAATTALAVASGVAVVRVHDVPGALQAARTADAIVRQQDAPRQKTE